ncbi:MAG: hypothetical protein ACYTGG_09615 [Planctomycetota bacterium]
MILNDLAWLLATDPAPRPAAASRAVLLAERAAALTRRQSPLVLDTLAASYAAEGRFDQAVATARAAIAIARAAGRDTLAADIESRLALYERGLPYRDASGRRGPGGP